MSKLRIDQALEAISAKMSGSQMIAYAMQKLADSESAGIEKADANTAAFFNFCFLQGVSKVLAENAALTETTALAVQKLHQLQTDWEALDARLRIVEKGQAIPFMKGEAAFNALKAGGFGPGSAAGGSNPTDELSLLEGLLATATDPRTQESLRNEIALRLIRDRRPGVDPTRGIATNPDNLR